MRITLLTILLITSHLAGLAQLETSFIAGVNMAKQFEKGGRQSSDVSIDYIPGFNIGFAASNQVKDQLYIECSFLFEQKGANRKEVISLASSTMTNTDNVRLYYATVPMRAQYRILLSEESSILIGAGLYGSMGLLGSGNYTTKTEEDEHNVSYRVDWWDLKANDEFYKMDIGLTTQIGLKIKSIRIELNYDRGLFNISTVPTDQYRRFNQTFRLSFGYELEL